MASEGALLIWLGSAFQIVAPLYVIARLPVSVLILGIMSDNLEAPARVLLELEVKRYCSDLGARSRGDCVLRPQ
jgi:hypothetical protein